MLALLRFCTKHAYIIRNALGNFLERAKAVLNQTQLRGTCKSVWHDKSRLRNITIANRHLCPKCLDSTRLIVSQLVTARGPQLKLDSIVQGFFCKLSQVFPRDLGLRLT